MGDLIKHNTVTKDMIEPVTLSELELFKLFKKYDKNLNGFLEIPEYMTCMNDQGLEVTSEEVTCLSFLADLNGDGLIDYEEFMKYFTTSLQMVRFAKLL